jgi:hypothetical protein
MKYFSHLLIFITSPAHIYLAPAKDATGVLIMKNEK